MVRQSVRFALLAGTFAAVAFSGQARANDCCQTSPSCCTPATRTITVTECVPETYKVKRCTYRTEERIEKYTCYKCVPTYECRERCCTVYRKVPEWHEECRKVCVKVPCCEERTVMKPCYHYVTETKYVTKCVDRGHWECREEYSCFKALSNSLSGLCRKSCCDSCCDSCNSCCQPSNCVTRKHWVSCKVQECCPVTCCRKVCEMKCEVCKVHTCRTEWREEKVKVCCYRCVAEQQVQKYTVCVNKSVPYEATRCVKVCVPCEEWVTCTRLISRCVTREVPCCTTSCSSNCCEQSCGHSLFSWFRSCNRGCGSCGSSCGTCGGGCSSCGH